MDPAPLVVVAIIAVIGIALFFIASESQKRQASWGTLAELLGLNHEGSVLLGEYEGLPVRIGMETRRNPYGYDQVCVVSAEVPGELPSGFVAAPRRWTTGLDRMLADNTFVPSDSALKECYILQSDRPQEGQVLVEQAEVQKALLELYSPKRVGFVEKHRTHVAYSGFMSDVEELRSALKDVVHTARTLAEVQARLAPGPETRLTS
ncbi:hypothetical protein [Hyalangium sp.]|uniref:hypothetical protein n=1 Tax=Hyalangium sp. TaxID=2028555 RepID=UPI002D4ED432|nr:hypothetical protein [Hyalangium sp.]HYI03151.1 hypothetical protein [Hyalangium sp.]